MQGGGPGGVGRGGCGVSAIWERGGRRAARPGGWALLSVYIYIDVYIYTFVFHGKLNE